MNDIISNMINNKNISNVKFFTGALVAQRLDHLCSYACLALCSTLLTFSGQSFAQAQVPTQKPKLEAPIVVTTTVEPWGFYGDANKQTGILVDFQRSLFARAGIAFNNQLKPYPRVIHEIANGQADLAVLFSGPQSDAIGHSLGKLTSVRILIVTRAGSRGFHSLEDFKGLKIGHVRGSKYGPAFDDNPHFTRIAINDAELGLRMLMSGRIDAMASTEHSLFYAMYHAGIDSTKLRVALSPGTASAELYVSRQTLNAPWLTAIQDAFNAMREDGSLDSSLYQNHYWPYESFCFAGGECLSTGVKK